MADNQALAAALMQGYAQKPVDERAYQAWVMANNPPQSNDYNMRAFYSGLMGLDPAASSAINPNDGRMHFPDKWKLPNHESFSTDSMYYNPKTMPNTPTWQGGPLPRGGESWSLRRPNGRVVASEAPWLKVEP